MNDERRWNEASSNWNEKALRRLGGGGLLDTLSSRLVAERCCYRFSLPRMHDREQARRDSWPHRPLVPIAFATGEAAVETPIVPALRPTFLPRVLLDRLINLGRELETLLHITNAFVRECPSYLQWFGDSVRGEFDWIYCNAGLSPVMQWTRLDYTWRWQDGIPALTLYDINLLPGMTFISEKISEICQETFAAYELCQPAAVAPEFDTRPLVERCRAYFQAAAPSFAEPLSLTVLVRSQHGLGCDAELCVSKVTQLLQGGNVATTTPPALRARLDAERVRDATVRRTNGVIRMARPISKHSAGSLGAADDSAFSDLTRSLKSGPPVYPVFNAYLENHAWFAIWQRDEFANFVRQYDAGVTLAAIKPLLPKTSVITPDGNLMSVDGSRPLSADLFASRVLKRGNSTGGRDLVVLNHASLGQRRAALAHVRAEPEGGWVLQELIEPQKETFPVVVDDHSIILQSGFMVYSAYYCGGQYFGGHAVMAPRSRKVHGGFGSFLVPMRTL